MTRRDLCVKYIDALRSSLVTSFPPQLRPGIFWIQLRQFSHDLLRALVTQLRNHNLYFDDLVPAGSVFGSRWHALLAHAQLLPALCTRRNLELSAPIDGRHLDLPSKRCLGDRDGDGHVDIVSFAAKHRMLFYADDNEQIARWAAPTAGIAFSSDADALTTAGSRFDTDFEGFGNVYQPLTVAIRTLILNLPDSVTSRAGHVELHATAGLSNVPAPFTFR